MSAYDRDENTSSIVAERRAGESIIKYYPFEVLVNVKKIGLRLGFFLFMLFFFLGRRFT